MLIDFLRNSKVFKIKMQTKEKILRNLRKNPKLTIKSQRKRSKKTKKKTRTRKNPLQKKKTKKNPLRLLLQINLPKSQRNKKLRKKSMKTT